MRKKTTKQPPSLLQNRDPYIINIKDAPEGWEKDDSFQYIGRAGKGQDGYFGNPIEFNKPCPVCKKIHTEKDRTDVYDCYMVYAKDRIEKDPEFKNKILNLKNKILVCFCKPKLCHGDGLVFLYKDLQDGIKKTENKTHQVDLARRLKQGA